PGEERDGRIEAGRPGEEKETRSRTWRSVPLPLRGEGQVGGSMKDGRDRVGGRRRMSRPVPRALLAVFAGVAPIPAAAEQRFDLRPSLVLGQVWDDNLFSSAEEPQADAITSLGPGL